ncbi:hypothetical protein IWW38_002467 [Coemansia aciculifera]|uniref:Uncharacterized protein n=1 Tax=Coemansia aciculifera TaxID=417176 RepID=A0ACC1M3Z9_9FUNG|nr:hypothetical protein IWW38_002467 [Coemansia aciculifera]
MEQIRYVKIPLAETRTEPDRHVEYALNVQGPVRSWTVWHRYNDFLSLAYELEREFPGTTTPSSLPPKSLSSWFAKANSNNVEFIEERRHSLERYIQGMIMSDDDRWRTSRALQRFLAPSGKGSKYFASKNGGLSGIGGGTGSETGSADSDVGWVTAGSWLNDQRDAEQIIRDVRQSILRRENALTRNEVSVSHQCLLQAKRQLTDLGRTLKALEQGLEQISSTLAAGELLRRQDMLMRLGEEKANLTQLVLGPGVVSGGSDRAALLSGASTTTSNNTRLIGRAGGGNTTAAANGNSYNMPGAMPVRTHKVGEQGTPQPRSRRIFGNSNPPQETNETRGLDSQGLLQLQTERMREQDLVAAEFSALLRRQREMGETIGNELDMQNQLLTELDQDMDRTTNKLAAARRQANKL